MVTKYYQKHKERSEKKHVKNIKIFPEKKKTKAKKKSEKDINILLRKKKKKSVSITRNVRSSYQSIEEAFI